MRTYFEIENGELVQKIKDDISYKIDILENQKIEDLEKLYKDVTGQSMKKYYRPPQGKYSPENLSMAKKLGYKTIFWSLAYVDWYNDDQPSEDEAFSKLIPRIHSGAIVLLHSTSETNSKILDELLTKWEKLGYSFGTLDEL